MTNASWLDGDVDSGVRACLAEEFTSIHVVNFRGDVRKNNKDEGGNVFDVKSPSVITIFCRNPAFKGCRIYYHDFATGKTGKEKLLKLRATKSVKDIPSNDWTLVEPDDRYDWIAKQEKGFKNLIALGSDDVRSGKTKNTVFYSYRRGYETARDAYLYNFSHKACEQNAQLMIKDYQIALQELGDSPTINDVRIAASRHANNRKWNNSLQDKLRRRIDIEFCSDYVTQVHYRPFQKQYCYADDKLVHRPAIRNLMFPVNTSLTPPHRFENRAICIQGTGQIRQPFSVLMTDRMPDLELISKSQIFPRWRYPIGSSAPTGSAKFENPTLFSSRIDYPTSTSSNSDNVSRDGGSAAAGGVFDDGTLLSNLPGNSDSDGLQRIDNITDHALRRFQNHYKDDSITKDAIFDYVYGVLYAPDFRETFPIALSRNLPRVPMATDFWTFAEAGQELAGLHLNYETGPEYPLHLDFSGAGEPTPDHYRFSDTPMRFAGKKGNQDRSVLQVTRFIRLSGIPDAAHDYVVNGRTPLEWFIDRYRITVDKKSGIRNDPNDWFKDPGDIVPAIRRIVHVSVETTRIVRGLPATR